MGQESVYVQVAHVYAQRLADKCGCVDFLTKNWSAEGMDHQQQNLVRTAINTCGFASCGRWQRHSIISELGMALLRRGGRLVSVDSNGSVFAGGTIRILATEIAQMGWIKQPEIAGMSELEGEN